MTAPSVERRRLVPASPDAPAARSVEAEVARILEFIGEDPAREGLRDTPARVARSLLELTRGYDEDPAQILTTAFEERYDEPVLVRDIGFWSLCEHHLLPFRGTAAVAYVPQGRVVGGIARAMPPFEMAPLPLLTSRLRALARPRRGLHA